MKKQSRRKFVASAVALGTSAVATGMPTMESKDKKQLVHHVFFWLKNPDSREDLAKLLAGLQTLGFEVPRGVLQDLPSSQGSSARRTHGVLVVFYLLIP